MERLVYTPKVEVLIMLENESRLVDVTDDIVSGTVNRRLNAMSDIQLVLQNKNGRYTKVHRIEPMDRIIVRMSRVGKPMLVFSGFVDDAPYYQLYPGTVTVAASDTLKLLQHTYFDPGLPAVQGWFISQGWQYNPDTGALYAGPGGVGNNDLYGNMKDIIKGLLTDIANWPEQGITIYDLPTNFLKSIANVMQDASDAAEDIRDANLKILSKLYGTEDITGSTSSIVGDTSSLPSTGNIDIVDVARLALQAGFTGDQAVIAVAIAQAESGLRTQAMNFNVTGGTYDTGLWQINSVHTASGTGLAAPPGGGGTLNMPSDWDAVKGSIASSVRNYIEAQWTPKTNAASAYSIFSGAGFQFTPWSTFNNQAYKNSNYLAKAADAISKAKITPNNPIPIPATSGTSSTDTTKTSADATTTKIVQVAQSQVGVHGSGGNNFGSAIKTYQDYVGISQGEPWCAAFASWVYGQAGLTTVKSGNVAGLESLGKVTNSPQPADMIHWGDDHVGIVTAVSGKTISFIAGNNGEDAVGNGTATVGVISTGFGVAPTFIHFVGVGTSSAYVGTIGNQDVGGFTKAQIMQLGNASAFFTQQFQSSDMTLASMLTGERAIANDIPVMEWIDNIVPASGRVYCTTPAGSFLAFFPDRWGFFERTPYFHINDIEIIDLTINRNDTNLTTHVFTTGPILPDFGITNFDRMNSMVASIEDEAFKYFVNIDPSFDRLAFLAHYGARPYVNDMMNVNNPLLLWMNGWMKFMELWAKRFTANGSFTFMPELLPGGLVSFGNRVQMFVEGVTHTFDMGGGFSTTAELSSLTALDTDEFSELTNTGGQLDPLVAKERFNGAN